MTFWAQLRSLFADVAGEIIVRVDENDRGGFSIFPVNEAAVRLFSGPCEQPRAVERLEAGNFGTYADAYKRAARDNCWTVVEAPDAPATAARAA